VERMRTAGLWVLLRAPLAPADLIAVENKPNGKQYRVSTADGSTTVIGNTGVSPFFAGLSSRSDGEVFGLTVGITPFLGDPQLHRIDPATGATTLIGKLDDADFNVLYEGGFAISPDGTGYALHYASGFTAGDPTYLIAIDLDTAAYSLVGELTPRNVSGLAFRGDGALVGLDDGNDALIAIDTATAATSTIGHLGFDAGVLGGLAAHGGAGYLVEGLGGTSRLHRIDLYTGATSLIGDTGVENLSGLTGVVPEPGTFALLGAALVAWLWRRRASAR